MILYLVQFHLYIQMFLPIILTEKLLKTANRNSFNYSEKERLQLQYHEYCTSSL